MREAARGKRRVVVGLIIGAAGIVVGLSLAARSLMADDRSRIESLIKTTCAGCHRLEGEPASRLEKKAPDLIGVGSKFTHEWLVGWLAGKEQPVYTSGYRWDQSQAQQPHVTLPQAEAEAMAEYLEANFADPKIKPGSINMATFSKQEASFGEAIFKEHACIGCHQIQEGGKTVGGLQSTSLANAGRRLKADWIYRFNSNPPDYVPHSGEFVGDVSELGLRYVTGFIATRGWDDFPFYEPWTGESFGHPSADRGKVIYKEYCAQCHGAAGKGDGPAAPGLNPRPAIHANMAFDKLPTEYLYNVIYYGGRSVGKAATMPYWGLTIGQQGVADVIAYLRETFKGGATVAQAPAGGGALGVCPQPRNTQKAPEPFLSMTNPLSASSQTVQAGRTLFQESAKPLACMNCHGGKGDGAGAMGMAFQPPPRNFTCGQTMKNLPDGQLFWVIKHGSPGTGMMAFGNLSDDEVWQLIHYIRSLAKP